MKKFIKSFLVLLISVFLISCEDDETTFIDFELTGDVNPLVIYAKYPKRTYDGIGGVTTEPVLGPWFTMSAAITNPLTVGGAPNESYVQVLALLFKGNSSHGESILDAFPSYIPDSFINETTAPTLDPGVLGSVTDNIIPNDLSIISDEDYATHYSRMFIGDAEQGLYSPIIIRPGVTYRFNLEIFSIAGALDEGEVENDLRGSSFSYEVILQGIILDKDRKEIGSLNKTLYFSTRN